MNIKRAELKDAKDISLLNNEVQKIHHQQQPTIFKPPSLKTFPLSEIKEIIRKSENEIFVAQEEDKTVGYIFSEYVDFPETSIRYHIEVIHIQQISVKESHRNKGVGLALVKHIIKLARENKIPIVMLDVWSFNTKAFLFFKKQGFEVFNNRMWIYL